LSADATKQADEHATTAELLTGVVGDRCTNCQAPLASDQRYCVNCGERRGKARFSFAAMAAQAAPVSAQAPQRTPRHRSRASSGATLVAGVGTLLLAMGVGVLIGHDNNGPTRASSPGVQVVTVGGGGGGVSAGTVGGASSAGTAARATPGAHKAATATTFKAHLTPKVTKAAAAAAGKVLGGAAPKNPTITVGQSCSAGTAGCQGGKFTGNYFGP